MDSAVEKFNVFDFLNLIIAGFIFVFALGICHYPQVESIILEIAEKIGDSDFLLFIVIIALFCIALVSGLFFQVIGHMIIKEKLGLEKKMICTCLKNKKIFDNSTRFKSMQSKARQYLQMSDGEKLTKKHSEAFFAYCTYYIQIKGMNYKTEKLFETQGLSQLLVCVFFLTPFVSVLLYIVQSKCVCSFGINLWLLVSVYTIYFLLAFAFYYRYKISCMNRIKMILSIYEAMT